MGGENESWKGRIWKNESESVGEDDDVVLFMMIDDDSE